MPDIAANRPTSGAPIESTWGGQVHDAVEGVQAGVTGLITISAGNGSTPVVFPRAYSAPPAVVASVTATSFFFAQASAITATGFTATVRDIRDAQAGTGSVAVAWVAVGTPA